MSASRWGSPRGSLAGALTVVVCVLSGTGIAHAQAGERPWLVWPRQSLAWWQVEPNYGHLWATTCPDDPSWSAGESRSPGYAYRDEGLPVSAKLGTRIPLFPRGTVHPVCRDAVRGSVTIADTVHWTGVRGEIVLRTGQVTTGADFRDAYMQKAVFMSSQHPEVKFRIDSLTDVRMVGDSIHATAVGSLNVLGRPHARTARVVAWRVPEGLRVRARLEASVKDMTEHFGMSKIVLNMGVVLGRWDTLYMGIDIILRAPAGGA
jgi:hypothetical protein